MNMFQIGYDLRYSLNLKPGLKPYSIFKHFGILGQQLLLPTRVLQWVPIPMGTQYPPYPWVNGWVMGMGLDAWVGNEWVMGGYEGPRLYND